MDKLLRKNCAVLPLVLKAKWYDMIESGKKLEEYRDAKEYWRVRIENWYHARKPHHVVAFSRGRRRPTMFFTAEPKSGDLWWPDVETRRADAFPEWGEPETPHYVLRLGRRVELEGGPECQP